MLSIQKQYSKGSQCYQYKNNIARVVNVINIKNNIARVANVIDKKTV